MKRILKKLAKVVVVVLAVLVLVYSAMTFILGRKLEARLAALKAAGQPVSMSDLAGPPIPDSENAAVIYEQVFKDLSSPAYKKDVRWIPYSSPFWDFDKNPDWAGAKAAVERHARILDLMQEANAMPKFRLRVKWQPDAADFFPVFAKLRELSRYLHAYAVLESHYGNMDKAVRALELSIKSISKTGEPLLISHLVDTARVAIVSKQIEDVLRYGGQLNEAQAKRLYDALGRIDLVEGYKKAMIGERAYFLESISTGFVGGGRRARLPRLWLYTEEIAMIDYTNRCLKTAHLTYRELKSRGLVETKADFPRYPLLMRIMTPVYDKVAQQRDKGIATIGGSRIVLALQAYKDRFGSYPETLGELRMRIGWKLPKDPFSGKDFVYQKRPLGFLIYSFGLDLKDDGGKDWTKSKDRTGDIVWRAER